MDDALEQLYQDTILEHSRNPCNRGALDEATHTADGYNPSCGDTVHVALIVKDGRIESIRFTGEGCSISQASASMMAQELEGKTVTVANQALAGFTRLVTGAQDLGPDALKEYGDLAALAGVRKFPLRVKCATLAWHALEAALKGNQTHQEVTLSA